MSDYNDWDREYEMGQAQASRRASAAPRAGGRANALLDEDDDYPMEDAAPVQRNLFSDEEPETPLEQVIRHWVNERHAPDILPAQEELLSGLLNHLRQQVRSRHIQRIHGFITR